MKTEIMGIPVTFKHDTLVRVEGFAVTQVKRMSREHIGMVPATTYVPHKHKKKAKHSKRERESWY